MNANSISVHNLRKHFPGFLLDDISFQVPCGRIVGFIGENGAGKSTTIKLILGHYASSVVFSLFSPGTVDRVHEYSICQSPGYDACPLPAARFKKHRSRKLGLRPPSP